MKLADLDKYGLSWNNIIGFCRKNIRYISAGVICVALVVVLAVTTGGQDGSGKGTSEDLENQVEAFAEDAIPEINTLIQDYYAAYAAGDITAIEGLATPISEIEKSYITLMSQYISGYENIKVYTKTGLSENEYAASVVIDMGFEGLEASAPGMDFFYIRKDENGVYMIDNLYSQFNYQNLIQELDARIEEFIQAYETQQDVVQLCAQVQEQYDAAVAADADLKNMIDVTIPQALQTWWSQASAMLGDDTQTTPDDDTQTTPDEPQTTPDDEPQTTPDDEPQTTPDEPQTTPSDSLPAGTVVEVTGNSGWNMRQQMDAASAIVETVNPGEKVTVVESYAEGWTKVTWNGKTGYMKTELLSK